MLGPTVEALPATAQEWGLIWWAMENRQLQRGCAWNWAVGEFLMLQGKHMKLVQMRKREAHSKKIMHVFT